MSHSMKVLHTRSQRISSSFPQTDRISSISGSRSTSSFGLTMVTVTTQGKSPERFCCQHVKTPVFCCLRKTEETKLAMQWPPSCQLKLSLTSSCQSSCRFPSYTYTCILYPPAGTLTRAWSWFRPEFLLPNPRHLAAPPNFNFFYI